MPVEVTVRLLKKAMDESGKTKFLIDGFPRNMNNVDVRPNSDSYYKSTGTHSLRLRSLPACLPACLPDWLSDSDNRQHSLAAAACPPGPARPGV